MRSVFFLLSFFALALPVQSADSPWVTHDEYIRSRLIGVLPTDTGAEQGNGKVWVAWQAELADGWKTYWRSPGEAGLPVIAEQKGKAIELAYPLPKRFTLFGLHTFGYEKKVTIPFQIDKAGLTDGDRTIKMGFMICKDICIPYDVQMPLPDAQSMGQGADIKTWLDRVPPQQSQVITLKSSKVIGPVGRQRLVLDIAGQSRMNKTDAFVEFPAGFQGAAPRYQLQGDGKEMRIVIPIILRKKDLDLSGLPLRMTITDGAGNSVDLHVPAT